MAASWLDPGQEATHAVDVAFPAEALTAKKLTRLRLEIGCRLLSLPGRDIPFRRIDREASKERGSQHASDSIFDHGPS
jgi:hypothetical protein